MQKKPLTSFKDINYQTEINEVFEAFSTEEIKENVSSIGDKNLMIKVVERLFEMGDKTINFFTDINIGYSNYEFLYKHESKIVKSMWDSLEDGKQEFCLNKLVYCGHLYVIANRISYKGSIGVHSHSLRFSNSLLPLSPVELWEIEKVVKAYTTIGQKKAFTNIFFYSVLHNFDPETNSRIESCTDLIDWGCKIIISWGLQDELLKIKHDVEDSPQFNYIMTKLGHKIRTVDRISELSLSELFSKELSDKVEIDEVHRAILFKMTLSDISYYYDFCTKHELPFCKSIAIGVVKKHTPCLHDLEIAHKILGDELFFDYCHSSSNHGTIKDALKVIGRNILNDKDYNSKRIREFVRAHGGVFGYIAINMKPDSLLTHVGCSHSAVAYSEITGDHKSALPLCKSSATQCFVTRNFLSM